MIALHSATICDINDKALWLRWLAIASVTYLAGCAGSPPTVEHTPTRAVEPAPQPPVSAERSVEISPLPAQKPCTFAPVPERVGPCAPNSAEWKQAEQQLQSLDAVVEFYIFFFFFFWRRFTKISVPVVIIFGGSSQDGAKWRVSRGNQCQIE